MLTNPESLGLRDFKLSEAIVGLEVSGIFTNILPLTQIYDLEYIDISFVVEV